MPMTFDPDKVRFAVVVNESDVERVQRYMPSNYRADATYDGIVIIHGADNAGWTLDGYVIPRLASGMIVAVEHTPVGC